MPFYESMIESYFARLKECEEYDVKSVILFGSVARSQAKEHSDVDLIIVASGLPELKRRDVLPHFQKPARIQDIISKTGFVVDALLEGRVLQDDGTVAIAQERLATSLKRLKARRQKSGWMIPRADLRAVISFD